MGKWIALLLGVCCAGMGVPAYAQSAQELIDAGKNPDNVPAQGMGYHLRNYSPLNQITKSNVKRLVPVWAISLQNSHGETAQPTVYDGVMYVINATQTFAIDVATGQQLWRTEVSWPPETARQSAAGLPATRIKRAP